jgi:FkbM family methyltransferase
MKKPFYFYFLPYKLQKLIFWRFFYPVKEKWYGLFDSAPLRYAPEIKMKLLPSDFMLGLIAFTGIYERPLSKCVLHAANIGGTMIDVGANFGYFSLIWASANKRNKVIAFEASPRNHKYLVDNVDSNGLSEKIDAHPFALGSSNSVLDFDPGPSDMTGWGGLKLMASDSSIRVPVKRLDEILDPNIVIDFMKIDVEGADTWVLMGAEKLLLEKRIKEIHFEQNKPRLRQINIGDDDAVRFLDSVGYDVQPLSDPSNDIVAWCANPRPS